MWKVEQLREFESEVVRRFENKEIPGPVHLSHGNEESLIEIFKEVGENDWVFSTWRNHYHALLHGVPSEYVMQEILAGKSINLHAPARHFFTSAIVGGIIPIATGVAKALKMQEDPRHVWCFIGDMAASIGICHESFKYAEVNDLPITFVIEDNGLSTNTPTPESWGFPLAPALPESSVVLKMGKLWYYRYTRFYPHTGVGKFIHF